MSAATQQPDMRVLVCVDLTERSRNAFARAVELARAPGTDLKLLHVTSDALPHKVADTHESYARDMLHDLALRARSENVGEVEPVLVRGRDYEAIISEARRAKADLIIIGTHRPSSLAQDMLGTTSDRVLRFGGIPVLLARTKPEGGYGSIIVAVDFSSASRRALELMVRWFPAARIRAVTAYGGKRRSLLSQDTSVHDAAAETQRLAIKGFLDEISEAMGPEHADAIGRIEPHVERGWAEDVILNAAQEAKPDLIVVGTHARGGLQQAIIGSVAEWVLTEAPCDVLAVPPAD